MSQNRKETAARVYLDGGPTIHLPLPERESMTAGERQGELRMLVLADLREGVIEQRTTDGEWIQIPAGRVVSIVYPDPTPKPSDPQVDAIAWLETRGTIADAVEIAGAEFVEAYLAERAFGPTVVVETVANGRRFVGEIVSHDDNYFTIESPSLNEGDPATHPAIDEIRAVLCWSLDNAESHPGFVTDAGAEFEYDRGGLAAFRGIAAIKKALGR